MRAIIREIPEMLGVPDPSTHDQADPCTVPGKSPRRAISR
jgi:hypothetical protein